ncbi:winged helix-turn-helix domain-containing protein [Serratia sp. (in: enterobacteria)]|uniref:winged helix-turn-helix domain-containing protein n=1 Tax=Serratia sp. (in: enterobacteria) TaxID=616 RepID=UPI00398989DC
MPAQVISLSTARVLHLAAQGLKNPPTRKATPADLLDVIRTMGLLQIDTISVVARSPYLVLFTRLGDYPAEWLENALAAKQLFEYWAHEACFIPIEDFALLRHRMLYPEHLGWKYSPEWREKHHQDIEDLLGHIAQNGPVRSADFSRENKNSTGWWDWKPEKRHLETLFTAGELMVSERKNFHRVYDLTSRILPDWNDDRDTLSAAEAQYEMLRRSSQYLGIFKAEWLADYYRLKRIPLRGVINRLEEDEEIAQVSVEGFSEPFYVHHTLFPLLAQSASQSITSTVTSLLSPFDPIVWDRKRALALFNFDYRIECYTPQAKRQYGYFVLPILHRGELIGRTDAKIHRREQVFEVKALYLEPGTKVGSRRINDLTKAISQCARWHGATRVVIGAVPEALRASWQGGWEIV